MYVKKKKERERDREICISLQVFSVYDTSPFSCDCYHDIFTKDLSHYTALISHLIKRRCFPNIFISEAGVWNPRRVTQIRFVVILYIRKMTTYLYLLFFVFFLFVEILKLKKSEIFGCLGNYCFCGFKNNSLEIKVISIMKPQNKTPKIIKVKMIGQI